MTTDTNVVPLFASTEEVDSAWDRYDAAMRRTHALYADPASGEAERREAAFDALRAETEFRAVFARTPSSTRIKGA